MLKKSIMATAALAVSLPILLASPPDGADAAEPGTPSYSWEEVKAFSVEKKDELAAWLGRQLGDIDEETAAWLKQAGQDAASGFREADAELQEQRRVVADYIEEARAASAEEWESLKGRALSAVDELKDAYRSAREAAQ